MYGTERTDLNIMTPYIETCFVEIDKDKTGLDQNVIVGVVYKPPNGDIDEFSIALSQKIQKVLCEKKTSVPDG